MSSVSSRPDDAATPTSDRPAADASIPASATQGPAMAGHGTRAGTGGALVAGRAAPRSSAGAVGGAGRSGTGAAAGAATSGMDAGAAAGTAGPLAPTLPCASHCPEAAPVCDHETLQCVECREGDTQACPRATPACDMTHHCVECTDNDAHACLGAKPVCDVTHNRCVECLGSQPDSCTSPRPRCDEGQQQCVECLEHSDCPAIRSSRCDTQHCIGCQANAECARFPSTPVCDREQHACVACTVESEALQCPAPQRCDRSSHSCVLPRSDARTACEPCDTDAACGVGMRCASPGDIAATRVCLPLAPSGTLCDMAPYRVPVPVDANLSAYVCAPYQTCQTVLAAFGSNGGMACQTQNGPSVCGAGICAGGHCRYPCSVAEDCPPPLQCQLSLGACAAGYVEPGNR
jgi:hypothetical protein